MVLIITILIICLLGFKTINKIENETIENILEKGELKEEIFMKGDIFYKTRFKKDELISYLVYIRLEDGEEITVDNQDFYVAFNTGDVTTFVKNKYSYKSNTLTFYSSCLDGLENIRLLEKLENVS